MSVTPIGAEPRLFALVPCAGTGSRAGTRQPKQYEPLAGQAVVAHTLAALSRVERLAATLVVLSPDDDAFEDHAPGFQGDRAWVARCGGATRAESVANGLNALRERGAQPHDWVLVHDAARCLIRPAWVDRLIDACADDEVGGLLALPLADTLKAETEGRASATVDRAGKWAAQTPQMFRLGLLAPALAFAGEQVTDEAGAVEALGHRPRLVPGELENLKLTWPGDFALAARLLATVQPGPQVRAFVPAKDFALSQQFYADVGFEKEFAQDDLAGFTLGDTGFLLQNFHEPVHTANFMMYAVVPDLAAFAAHLARAGIAQRYGVRIDPPEARPWGRIDMVMFDPSGVLWRVSQRMEEDS